MAQTNLGFMYHFRLGVPKNFRAAAKWFRRAAEQGHVTAQHSLGAIYYAGWGVPRNDVLAHMWTSLGAAQIGEADSAVAALLADNFMQEIRIGMTPAMIRKARELAAKKQREIEARKKAK